MRTFITDKWRAPIGCLYRVTDGVYIGSSHGGLFLFVDLITGAEYYADSSAYHYASIEYGQRLYMLDSVMHDLRVWVSVKDGDLLMGVQPGYWRDGYIPEWIRRDGSVFWYEITYERWIIRGYVDCGEPNGSTTVNK